MKYLFVSVVLFTLATFSFAKTVTLYEAPIADSKQIGTIDSEKGMIAIYAPPEGNWVKVADPTNGNVGWIKASELGETGFSYHVISTGDDKHHYQVIQYGGGTPYTKEELQIIMQNMQKQQRAVQKHIQRMMKDMYQDMHEWMELQMSMPTLVLPEKTKNKAPPAKPTRPAPQTAQ